MRNAPLIALTLLSAWTLGHAPAAAHGGPPATYDVLLSSGDVTLVSSHGFFADDMGWAWICDEATDADVAASATRTSSRWFVGTLYGLKTSVDGCEWVDDPGLIDTHILRVIADTQDPERVWIVTMDGLWVVDGLDDARLDWPAEFSLRHAGQRADGGLLLVGFDGPSPVAQLGAQRIPLPAETGRIEVLSADALGRFYLRFPAGMTDRLVRVSEAGAEVLIAQTELIRDVASLGDALYVLYSSGVSWSADDGAQWAPPTGAPITCLRHGAEGVYACPPQGSGAALWHAPVLAPDPTGWPWDPALDFSAVAPHACAPGSTVRNICPLIWPIVSEELGILTEAPAGDTIEAPIEPSGCGVGGGGRGAAPRWALGALLMLSTVWRRQSPVGLM